MYKISIGVHDGKTVHEKSITYLNPFIQAIFPPRCDFVNVTTVFTLTTVSGASADVEGVEGEIIGGPNLSGRKFSPSSKS